MKLNSVSPRLFLVPRDSNGYMATKYSSDTGGGGAGGSALKGEGAGRAGAGPGLEGEGNEADACSTRGFGETTDAIEP